jgi:hypothetical protein
MLVEGIGVSILGLLIISVACYFLLHGLDRKNERNIALSLTTLRVLSWLFIGGFIILILGILAILGVIPWWSSSTYFKLLQ